MAAILFLIFGDEKLKIQLGIHHSRIQHPQNRLKRKFAIFYSKMPRMTLNELFSEIFPSLYAVYWITRNQVTEGELNRHFDRLGKIKGT